MPGTGEQSRQTKIILVDVVNVVHSLVELSWRKQCRSRDPMESERVICHGIARRTGLEALSRFLLEARMRLKE